MNEKYYIDRLNFLESEYERVKKESLSSTIEEGGKGNFITNQKLKSIIEEYAEVKESLDALQKLENISNKEKILLKG